MDDISCADPHNTQTGADGILKDVIAYVEVYSGRDNRSKAICWVLEQLGAKVEKSFTDDVTHVIFKEGSKRTLNKAQKKNVHLVSVLWIDSCKQKQERVSERFFPAAVPDEKSTPSFLKKRKKAKSMQPNDVEEDLANSAERYNKKKRRLDLLGLKVTPSSSPRTLPVLAEDTQPRSAVPGIFTPVRLYISETPPSMKAKMEQIQRNLGNSTNQCEMKSKTENNADITDTCSPLKKRLFGSVTDEDVDSELSINSTKTDSTSEVNKRQSQSAEEKIATEENAHVLDLISSVSKSTRSKRKSLALPEKITSLIVESRKTRRNSIATPVTSHSWKKNHDQQKSPTNKTVTFSDSAVVDVSSSRSNSMPESNKKRTRKSLGSVSNSDISKPKPETKMKKKLLSLTDLNEPVTMLVEPSKCSAIKAVLHDLCDQKQTGRKRDLSDRSKTRKSKRKSSDVSDEEICPDTKRSCLRDVTILDANKKEVNLKTDVIGNDHDTTDTGLSSQSNKEDPLSLSMSAVFDPSFSVSRLARPRDSIAEFKPNRKQPAKSCNRSLTKNSKTVKQKTENGMKMSVDKSSRSSCQSSDIEHEQKSHSRQRTNSFQCHSRPSLVMTSLHSNEQELVIRVIRKLGKFQLSNNVCENTTHLICGAPRRTLNIMHGLARGCWLVSKEWVLESLEAGCWLDETPYEVTDMFPTAKNCREEMGKHGNCEKSQLFSSLGPIFISHDVNPPRDQLSNLVKLCQGQVTCSQNRAEIFIGSESHTEKMCVTPNWIFDCVTEQKLLPIENYRLSRPTRETSPEF